MQKSLREVLSLKGCDLIFEYKGNVIAINTEEFTEEKEEAVYQQFGLKTLRGNRGIALYNPEVWRATNWCGLELISDCLAPEQPFFVVAPRLKLEGVKDLSHWDVASAKSLWYMFYCCESLKELVLDGWDVSRVEDMRWTFYSCKSLEKLSLDGWDVSSVTNLHWMFYNCESLENLSFDGWDVSGVKDMCRMFYGCRSLKSLCLDGWDVSSVEDTSWMFSYCRSLKNLSLNGWCISADTDTFCMFKDCPVGISVDSLIGSRTTPCSVF